MSEGYARFTRSAPPRPRCTADWIEGERGFYALNPQGNYLYVLITAITHKRIVIVPIDGDGAPSGKHRSIVPANLVRQVPAGGRVVG